MALVNKKARRNFEIIDELEAGVMLKGSEVKSLRVGRGSLHDAFVRVKDGEAWVYNWLIPRYQGSGEGEETRARKLLLHKAQILHLQKRMEGSRLTMVPLKSYFTQGHIKLKLGLARGKRQFEKRAALKKRTIERELRRQFKEEQLK